MVFVNLYLFQRAKVDSTGSIHVQDIPYSGFISWEKIFASGWHLCVLRIEFSRIAIISATPPESEQASASASGRGAHMQYSQIIFSQTGTDPRNSRKISPVK